MSHAKAAVTRGQGGGGEEGMELLIRAARPQPRDEGFSCPVQVREAQVGHVGAAGSAELPAEGWQHECSGLDAKRLSWSTRSASACCAVLGKSPWSGLPGKTEYRVQAPFAKFECGTGEFGPVPSPGMV